MSPSRTISTNSTLSKIMLLFSRPVFLCFAGVCGLIGLKKHIDDTSTTETATTTLKTTATTNMSPLPHQEMKSINSKQSNAMFHNNNMDPTVTGPKPIPEKRKEFHTPPINNSTGTFNKHYYDDNPTVFGSILRGEISSNSLDESNTLYAFQDIHPAAPLHGLVIPKKHIKSVYSLTSNDLPMLYEMKEMAHHLLQTYTTVSVDDTTHFLLVFHIPPFYTVDHLHLHVLAPVKEMDFFYRQIKYPSTEVRWCTHIDNVIRRLESGKSAVPYKFR
jgi:diadenosine tetraphosphate (Ap4A) HIT family hydrolase